MKCQSCNKFATPEVEVEVESDDYEDRGDAWEVTVRLTVTLSSQCCSDTMATAEVEDTVTVPLECKCEDEDEADVSVAVEAEPTDWYVGHNKRTGKPYPMRYQKHFYGADVKVTATCATCEETAEAEAQIGEQASNFEAY